MADTGMGPGGLATGMAGMAITPKSHGTVKAISPFYPEEDAKILRKAMKGIGTDEKAIINVLGYRTNKQRIEIKSKYKQAFGKDLVKDLKSELSGNFETLVKALLMRPIEYDAYCLNRAMRGAGTDEETLIEILVSRSNKEINEIKQEYHKTYKRQLEKDIVSETSGHFKRLLVSLCNASRDENLQVDYAKARKDAQDLLQAGEKKWGTDESQFNMILCSRSRPQLGATAEEYRKLASRTLIQSIDREMSGDLRTGMKAAVEVTQSPASYFAHRIHSSMKGAGTDDDDLIRTVVTRSEVDMVEVKKAFQQMYSKPLAGFIRGDTSGDYKNLLLALVGS